MGIRICPECGGKVSTSRNECIHCGYVFPATKVCPDCEESIDVSAKVCPICGYIFENVVEMQPSTALENADNTPQVTIAPIVPVVVPVATETVQTMQQPTNATPIDETTPIVCPQCGSNDIELKSSELGKCKHCGTTVVLPKKEQNVTVVNNFVVSNNSEDSAQYYIINRERTLDDEFRREAYVALTEDRRTPVDVSNGVFDYIGEGVEQYIEVDAVANITYSATVGYDYQVQYTEVDSNGNRHTKTKTETRWEPFSGSLIKDSTVYVGNDEHSFRQKSFEHALKSANIGSVVPYNGTQAVDVAPLPPERSAIEDAKKTCIDRAESEAKRSLPGDHYRDFHASGSATVKSVNSYAAPTQDSLLNYKDTDYLCQSFAFGSFVLDGDVPDDSNSIHKAVEKRTTPFLIASLALAAVTLLLSIIACTCKLTYSGGQATIAVPLSLMMAMFVATMIYTILLYRKFIKAAQIEKVKATSERLEALNFAPMTEEEIKKATKQLAKVL